MNKRMTRVEIDLFLTSLPLFSFLQRMIFHEVTEIIPKMNGKRHMSISLKKKVSMGNFSLDPSGPSLFKKQSTEKI